MKTMHQSDKNSSPTAANRMTQSDGPAVNVCSFFGKTEFIQDLDK